MQRLEEKVLNKRWQVLVLTGGSGHRCDTWTFPHLGMSWFTCGSPACPDSVQGLHH